MSQPTKWFAGQKVFVVLRRNGRYGTGGKAKWYTVASVGRRWVHLEESAGYATRFDKRDGSLDGGGYISPGRAYATEEEYLSEQRRDTLVLWARKRLDYSSPTLAQMEAIAGILGGAPNA